MKYKKTIYKIASYLIILTIFFFLGKNLFDNWQKVKGYDFSFNYFYLLLSFFFLFLMIISFALIWNKILRILEPTQKLSNFKAIKIFIYSWLGRYIPGKVWLFLGRVYLGQKEGLNKKNLVIGTAYEIVLSIVSVFLFSIFFLSISFGMKVSNFYIIPMLIIPIGLFLVHPKILYYFSNLFLRKFKNIEIPLDSFLSYKNIIRIIFYFFIAFSFNGIGFFFLVRSIVYLPFCDIIGAISAFIFASALGMVAIFAPSGLGIREGVLVLLLQFYFPLSIAILISLIARIWATIGEAIALISVYLYSKFKKNGKYI